MVTQFTSRKLVRDGIKALFDADTDDLWESIYSGMPNYRQWSGETPVLTILSNSVETSFAGQDTNPRKFQFIITNWVLYRTTDNSGVLVWENDDAEDLLDSLEVKVAQVIRDNASGGSFADLLQFETGASQINRAPIEQNVYITESFNVTATLNCGVV